VDVVIPSAFPSCIGVPFHKIDDRTSFGRPGTDKTEERRSGVTSVIVDGRRVTTRNEATEESIEDQYPEEERAATEPPFFFLLRYPVSWSLRQCHRLLQGRVLVPVSKLVGLVLRSKDELRSFDTSSTDKTEERSGVTSVIINGRVTRNGVNESIEDSYPGEEYVTTEHALLLASPLPGLVECAPMASTSTGDGPRPGL
jgi:hypothetical protein